MANEDFLKKIYAEIQKEDWSIGEDDETIVRLLEEIKDLSAEEAKITLNTELSSYFKKAHFLLSKLNKVEVLFENFKKQLLTQATFQGKESKDRLSTYQFSKLAKVRQNEIINMIRAVLIECYHFIQDFRKFITKEEMKYAIDVTSNTGKTTYELAIFEFEDIEDALNVTLTSDGKLQLSINNFNKEAVNQNAYNQEYNQKLSKLWDDFNLRKQAFSKAFPPSQKEKDNEQKVSDGQIHLNKGQVSEAALSSFSYKNFPTSLTNLRESKIATKIAKEALNKTPSYAGGDISKEELGQILGVEFEILQKQITKNQGIFGTSFATLSVISNALKTINIIASQGTKATKKQLKELIFSPKNATNYKLGESARKKIAEKIGFEAKTEFEKSLLS